MSIAGRPGSGGSPERAWDGLRAPRRPTRATPRVALATCREHPAGDEDAPLLLAACSAAGLDAEWRVWDDAAVDWDSYDLVVIRSTWDYVPRRDDFAAWAASVPRLANPADVVRWNTDKTYLRDLAGAGVPVVPTEHLAPGDAPAWPADWLEVVVKPAVSAGGQDTARYGPGDVDRARTHAGKLLAASRRVLVQPYLTAVDEVGETAVVHVGGAYSHSLGKAALLLPGAAAEIDELWRPERIEAREPSAAERAVAEQALAAVPGGPERLLYARVDLLPGPDGDPLVIELELTEPSLFLTAVPAGADRFAAAIRRAVTPDRAARRPW
ncbi:MAG: RimK family alpha-L-glutamate ligase [Mycobacteriales bacterium]